MLYTFFILRFLIIFLNQFFGNLCFIFVLTTFNSIKLNTQQSKMKNTKPIMHPIAIAKNSGTKFAKRLLVSEQIEADGKIVTIIKTIYFVMFKLEFIIFLIIFKFKRDVMIKQIPKPQISEFIPIIFGKNQIDKNIMIAPKT